MRHVLWLLAWVSSAQAQPLAPVLLNARPASSSSANESAPKLTIAYEVVADTVFATVDLAPPCFGCKASLRAATGHYATPPVEPVPAAKPSTRASQRVRYALGDSWNLGAGRILSIRLTPTPEECAPLVRLSF
jgi:hypothetical protein